jgi:hypothetical protein
MKLTIIGAYHASLHKKKSTPTLNPFEIEGADRLELTLALRHAKGIALKGEAQTVKLDNAKTSTLVTSRGRSRF